jgi:phosphate butyryltransferase
MTDGGMVVKPDIEQKIQILENSVLVARALRLKPVRVALSAAYDNVYDDVPQTIECRTIIEKVMDKKLDNVIIDGPMTFDSAVSKKAAEIKGLNSAVAGEADIYLVNSIEECNIIAKSLIGFADTIFAGVITGARVPISLVSRTDTMKNKKASVSIACLVAEYYKKEVAPTRGAAQE